MLPKLKTSWSPNCSGRGGAAVDLIVLHDCEGSYAGSINWFMQSGSQVSAHYVLKEDGTEVTQMVQLANKAWHACAFNPRSIGIEAAGYASAGLGAAEWQGLAALTAWLLHQYNIPPVWSRGGQTPGYCQHVDLGAAGGGHHDITSSASVWAAFQASLRAAYALPQETWGPGSVTAWPLKIPLADWHPSGSVRHDLIVGSVAWAQSQLNKFFGTLQLTIDDIEGPGTRAAVQRFQYREHLAVDGDIGPQTIAALKLVL